MADGEWQLVGSWACGNSSMRVGLWQREGRVGQGAGGPGSRRARDRQREGQAGGWRRASHLLIDTLVFIEPCFLLDVCRSRTPPLLAQQLLVSTRAEHLTASIAALVAVTPSRSCRWGDGRGGKIASATVRSLDG